MRLAAAVFAAVFPLCAACRAPGGPAGPDRAIVRESGEPQAVASGPERGAVSVAATLFWSEPGPKRDHDKLILEEKNRPAEWAGGMDASMRLWLVGKAETAALYGEPVVILERRGEWLKVAAEEQRTSLNSYGYPGWVPAVHITGSAAYLDDLKNKPVVAVVKKTAYLYADRELTSRLLELSYQTRLPLLEEKGRAVAVRLPNGETGYLSGSDVKKAGELAFSREGIVNEAMQFIGLPYIWAGTMSCGFDCSGFTMRLYQSQGVSIPRDADEQAKEGFEVAGQDLQPGDLVFFAAKKGLGQIHHVGMYIGNGMMIHSPNSSSSVRVEAVDGGAYGEEYWGARRYAR